jgi:hypothetical protein
MTWQRYPFRREDGKVTAYRLGSVADRYGVTFSKMPRLVHSSDEAGDTVIPWIMQACGLDRAAAEKTFRAIRPTRYGVVVSEGDGVWVGSQTLENQPF